MLRVCMLSVLAILLLAACDSATAPTNAPGGTPRPPAIPNVTYVPATVTPSPLADIVMNRSGGVAGLNETMLLKADGSVTVEQRGTTKILRAPDGAASYDALLGKIEESGIYNVAPGRYWPAFPGPDRFTMELALKRNGQVLVYSATEGTPGIPQPVFVCFQLVLQYVAAAKPQ